VGVKAVSQQHLSIYTRLCTGLRNRVTVWHLVLLGSICLFWLCWVGKEGARVPFDLDLAVIKRLAMYGVRYELNDDRRIVRLILEGPRVTDDALGELHKLSYLTKLSLRGSSITDAGLAKINALKRLQTLGITGTSVTNLGLGHLASMPSLRHLWVVEKKGRITGGGILGLRRALPGLQVHVMSGPDESRG
jgi:hypothetical protein